MDNVAVPAEWLKPNAIVPVTPESTRILVEALRAILEQPQQGNETPATLPSEVVKVEEERTCSFCKHHDDAKNYDETCWGCSTFYSNKWEPRT